jgi:beta-lactamase class D
VVNKKARHVELVETSRVVRSCASSNPDNGWFVGWLDRADVHTVYFALNIQPQAGPANDKFISARRAITEAVLREMKWL